MPAATPPPAAETETAPPTDDAPEGLYVPIANWEFINEIPTTETVHELLDSLPLQWGVRVADYLPYVQALPANKKVKVDVARSDGQGTNKVEQILPIYTLYMTVAGREQMLRAAAEINDWRVDLEPAIIPNQPPGFLAFDVESDRPIVYRETCTIWRNEGDDGSVQVCLGTKSGTAWVPGTGRQQAAKSNPVEKVETAARGRAIAAWGIGVLPGSGVASVEEMQFRATPAVRQRGVQARRSRDDLVDEILTAAERVRLLREIEDETVMRDKIASYASEQFDRQIQREDGTLDFGRLRDAHLVLVLGMLEQTAQRLEAAAEEDPETN